MIFAVTIIHNFCRAKGLAFNNAEKNTQQKTTRIEMNSKCNAKCLRPVTPKKKTIKAMKWVFFRKLQYSLSNYFNRIKKIIVLVNLAYQTWKDGKQQAVFSYFGVVVVEYITVSKKILWVWKKWWEKYPSLVFH